MIYFSAEHMPRWRNGRRGGLKIRFSVREWGFESLPGHHFFLPYPSLVGPFVGPFVGPLVVQCANIRESSCAFESFLNGCFRNKISDMSELL